MKNEYIMTALMKSISGVRDRPGRRQERLNSYVLPRQVCNGGKSGDYGPLLYRAHRFFVLHEESERRIRPRVREARSSPGAWTSTATNGMAATTLGQLWTF